MLNVAFTRARDEIHVFHSAPVETFGMARGQGALGEWMVHCAAVQAGAASAEEAPPARIDSEFEAEVASALRASGVDVLHQYPACGFRIDLVCELDSRRVAVECDGELYHKDEHGNLRIEDVERQGVLERAGWRVLRIPYRKWLADPDSQIQRIIGALQRDHEESNSETGPHELLSADNTVPREYRVTKNQRALIEAIRSGLRGEADVLRQARISRGHKRLGPRIREGLLQAVRDLNDLGLLVVEEGEYFLTAAGRGAVLSEVPEPLRRSRRPIAKGRRVARGSRKRRRSYRSSYYRRY